MINTKELLSKIFTDGGFTVHIASGLIPSTGYMVSIQGCEEVYHSEDITEDTIPGYITRHVKQLLIPGAYLGAWLDGDRVYLDVSINIDSLEESLSLARVNSQLAIYDISRGESIYLDNRKDQQSGKIEEFYSSLDDYDYREYLERLWSSEYDNERESRRLFYLEDKFQDYE